MHVHAVERDEVEPVLVASGVEGVPPSQVDQALRRPGCGGGFHVCHRDSEMRYLRSFGGILDLPASNYVSGMSSQPISSCWLMSCAEFILHKQQRSQAALMQDASHPRQDPSPRHCAAIRDVCTDVEGSGRMHGWYIY